MDNMPIETLSAEEIQRHYLAALDSVSLINAGQPEGMEDAEWADCLERNVAHLKIQLAKADMYEGYDLKPLQDAAK